MLARYDGWGEMPRSGGMWSWEALLPPCEPVSLGEVATPLIPFEGALIKDEGRLPTGTFKARGAAVGVAMARSLGASGAVVSTAGNAGAAWAAYCAKAGLPCAVIAAEGASEQVLALARLTGADVEIAKGGINEAVSQAAKLAADKGWHLGSSLTWRIEGKKTALFEISRDLGWKMPDAVVLPTGGGVGVIAFHQAIKQLTGTAWATGTTRIYAVQAEGCAPIVRAYREGVIEPWNDPKTDAIGIRIPNPPAPKLVLTALRESVGSAIAVDESSITSARDWVARTSGLVLGLESAAAVAGYEVLRKKGTFAPTETVVIFGTSSGRV